MLSNSSIAIHSNFSMPLNLDSGGVTKDPFNITAPGGFDSPPPPGGMGSSVSPLFNQPFFDLVPSIRFDLSCFKNLFFPNTFKELTQWIFSNLTEVPNKDSALSKYDVSSLFEGVSSKFERLHGRPEVDNRYFVYGASQSTTSRLDGVWDKIIEEQIVQADLSDPGTITTLQALNPSMLDENGDTLFSALVKKEMIEPFKFFLGFDQVKLTDAIEFIVQNKKMDFIHAVIDTLKGCNGRAYKKALIDIRNHAQTLKYNPFALLAEFLLEKGGWGSLFGRDSQEVFEEAFSLAYAGERLFFSKAQRLEFLKLFLAEKVDLNQVIQFPSTSTRRFVWKASPLDVAVEMGSLDMIKLLTEEGARITAQTLRLLVERASVQEGEFSVSMVKEDPVEILRFLVTKGLNVNHHVLSTRSPSPQSSALGYAIQQEASLAFVEGLIAANANVNEENRNEESEHFTPLLEAMSGRSEASRNYAPTDYHDQVIKLLLDAKANLNHVVQQTWAPLTYAIINGQQGLVTLFIERGANVDVRTPRLGGGFHRTPLLAAIYTNRKHFRAPQFIKELISSGADSQDSGGGSQTPIKVANSYTIRQDHNQKEIIKALQETLTKGHE